jgi:hypothetical protein
MTNNDSTRTKEHGQRASKTHRILAIFIIATGLAASGTAVFLRSPAKAIVTNTAIIVPSKQMQGPRRAPQHPPPMGGSKSPT